MQENLEKYQFYLSDSTNLFFQGPSSKKPRMAMTPEELALLEDELPLKLDCQMYLKKDNNNIIFQFVFLSGELGKNGMAELVQCVKRQLNIV